MNKKYNGTCILINTYDDTNKDDCEIDKYSVETVCFCKEEPIYVLEKLIQYYRIINYQGIAINDIITRPALSIVSIDKDSYKGMELTGSIDDFIDRDSKLLECKIDDSDNKTFPSTYVIEVLKNAVEDIGVNYVFYEKKFVDEIKDELLKLYNKLYFKHKFSGCSVIVGCGNHTRLNIKEIIK